MDRETLERTRKRMLYRCAHRGTKELDFMVGAFARRHLGSFGAAEIAELEAILELPEPLLQDLLLDKAAPPPGFDGPVMALFRGFHAAERR